MSRSKARENAFLLLFQESFFKGCDMSEIVDANIEVGDIIPDEFCRKLYDGVLSNKTEIDSIIETHLINWKKNRISRVALTVLRLAVFEMYYCDDIDDSVAISQGLTLLKKYDDEKAAAFVNGVLGSCSRAKNER